MWKARVNLSVSWGFMRLLWGIRWGKLMISFCGVGNEERIDAENLETFIKQCRNFKKFFQICLKYFQFLEAFQVIFFLNFVVKFNYKLAKGV